MESGSGRPVFANALWRLRLLALLAALLVMAGCELPFSAGTAHPVGRPTPTTAPVSPLVSQTVYWGQNTWLTALRASDGHVRWQIGNQWAASSDGLGSFNYGPLATTLADGVLYALGNNAQNSAAVYAFAASDGATRWQVPVAGCLAVPMAPPLVANGMVFVSLTGHWSGGINCKPTGWVYAFRVSDGHMLWRVSFAADDVWPTLALTNGILVVANSTDPEHVSNSMSYLSGLRASDGKQLWRISRATDKIEFTVGDGLVITKTTAGISYDSGLRVEAFRASDGSRLWASAVIPSPDPAYFMDPVLANGMAYVVSPAGYLYTLSASDGRLAWRFKAATPWIGMPIFSGSRIYVGIGPALDALNATSGALVHSYPLFDPTAFLRDAIYVWSNPVVTESTLFVSVGVNDCPPGPMCHPESLDGKLYALDVATGRILWQYQSPQGYQVTPPMLSA